MPPFTCPRCGSVSHSRHDARQGYCGHCHDWTGAQCYAPGGPASPGERPLTPDVLLTSGLFAYEGIADEGRTTIWGYDPLRGPWVSSWRPDLSMGAFTAEWTVNRLRLKVSAEVMARAVMARFPGGNVGESWTWEELARQLVPADQPAFGSLPGQAGRQVDVPISADQAAASQILRGSAAPGTPDWITDAIEVWEGCKDQARRERTLAELAQDVADATPQIRPAESGTDTNTSARWSPEDAGDVIL